MPRNSNLTRRALLAGVATTLAAPALGQSKGAFDQIGPDADPNDLIDQIWDPKREAFISVRELIDQLEQSPIILIGERHGFSPHQNRAAFILKALADRGRYPTLALEMLEPAQEPVINAYRARNPEYARGLGIALDWANTGWPDWSFYEPIFDAAFAAKLPIVGADLPSAQQREIELNGWEGQPSASHILSTWREDMLKAYCGSINDQEAERLALKQWQRDLSMAEVADAAGDVLLLCGRQHVRAEIGIPAFLTTDASVVSLEDQSSDLKEDGFTWVLESSPEKTFC